MCECGIMLFICIVMCVNDIKIVFDMIYNSIFLYCRIVIYTFATKIKNQ